MKLKPFKRVPILVAVGVIVIVCLALWLRLGWVDELEAKTFDWRVRFATNYPAPVATNLGFVSIQDESIAKLNKGLLGLPYGLYWPRHVYGRLVRELSAQGAKAVGFDVIFSELRRDHGAITVSTNKSPELYQFLSELHPGKPPFAVDQSSLLVDSDDFFAWQLKRAGNVIVAAERDTLPHALFCTNALALGDISAEKDSDGVLRRARAFKLYRRWHPVFEQAAKEFDLDLGKTKTQSDRIILVRSNGEKFPVPLDHDGNFRLADFVGDKIPTGMAPRAKPYTDERVWHMGIVMAAQELKLDLNTAQVELKRGRITLLGAGGLRRTIPTDAEGYFYINWSLLPNDPHLSFEPIEKLLLQDRNRPAGETFGRENVWQNKLVMVGSLATGNDLTDRGTTPLEKDTVLVSKHWNVANSVITGQFIHRNSLATDFLLIVLLGVASAFLTWQLRSLSALLSVLGLAISYICIAFFIYVQYRYWIPIFVPVMGALFMEHGCLVSWRVVFEQAEKRRVKSLFAKLVSPDVVNELLGAEQLSLGGARREITVLFADVRGFTAFTDSAHEKAVAQVQQQKLAGDAAQRVLDEQAREMLDTVNPYLALVAGMVKKHRGTLDKYIGDCVMAFWGAPTPDAQHALDAVRAAIDAQRAIDELNQQRREQNRQRELENLARASAGLPLLPLLPILSVGSGINSGVATAGLMGSDAHGWNYTVFGRDVNLASRLESLSGSGRILIGEATYATLLHLDPQLAARCVTLPPVTTLKGFREAINVYEMPWQPTDAATASVDGYRVIVPDETSVTGLTQRS